MRCYAHDMGWLLPVSQGGRLHKISSIYHADSMGSGWEPLGQQGPGTPSPPRVIIVALGTQEAECPG
jgi:hypothetical protein